MKSLAELPRNPIRDPGYSLADRRREEEALRTAVEMMKPECRPACAFPLGRLLTVICVKEREQIWRREEEK